MISYAFLFAEWGPVKFKICPKPPMLAGPSNFQMVVVVHLLLAIVVAVGCSVQSAATSGWRLPCPSDPGWVKAHAPGMLGAKGAAVRENVSTVALPLDTRAIPPPPYSPPPSLLRAPGSPHVRWPLSAMVDAVLTWSAGHAPVCG